MLMQAMRSERSTARPEVRRQWAPGRGTAGGEPLLPHPPASAMRVIAMLGNRMARLRDLLVRSAGARQQPGQIP